MRPYGLSFDWLWRDLPAWSWSDYVAVAARGGNGRRYRKSRRKPAVQKRRDANKRARKARRLTRPKSGEGR
jgi:hypothetical protein